MLVYQEISVKDDQDLFIIGDLHGCFDLYQKGVNTLGIRDQDVVVSLGDLTDRGKQNFRCTIEFTRKLNRYAIRGNHEDMMIKGLLEGDRRYYECWFQNGGHTVLNECGEEGATALALMLEDLPVVLVVNYRNMKLGFIHGGYPSVLEHLPVTEVLPFCLNMNKEQVSRFTESLMWDRDMIDCALEGILLPRVSGVDYVFHGHSYVPKPVISSNRVYMDTGSVFNGNLTFAYFDDSNTLQFYSTLEED